MSEQTEQPEIVVRQRLCNLNVGPTSYEVASQGIVHNGNGEQVWAICDFDSRLILLDASLGARGRRQRLRHEFYHAVCYHFPGTRDEEQEAEFGTSVHDWLDQQIDMLGGWATALGGKEVAP